MSGSLAVGGLTEAFDWLIANRRAPARLLARARQDAAPRIEVGACSTRASGPAQSVPAAQARRLRYGPLHSAATDAGHGFPSAFVIVACARTLVGWWPSRRAHAGFVLNALEQACTIADRSITARSCTVA